jgi:hypothetical protein
VFLGGGVGAGGEWGGEPDWRRLYRYEGGALENILGPCDSTVMSCGIDAVAVSPTRVYAVAETGGLGTLLWAPLPAE